MLIISALRTLAACYEYEKKMVHGKAGSKIIMNMVMSEIIEFIIDRIKTNTAGFLVLNLLRDK